MANIGIGAGTTIKYNAVLIAGVKDNEGPDVKIDSVEDTPLAVSDFARTKRAGLIDAGQLKLSCYSDKAQMATIYGIARTTGTWLVTYPDNSTWSCSGFWTEMGNKTPVDDMIMYDLTIELTGKPVFTAG